MYAVTYLPSGVSNPHILNPYRRSGIGDTENGCPQVGDSRFFEVSGGFEPPYKVLQTFA